MWKKPIDKQQKVCYYLIELKDKFKFKKEAVQMKLQIDSSATCKVSQ